MFKVKTMPALKEVTKHLNRYMWYSLLPTWVNRQEPQALSSGHMLTQAVAEVKTETLQEPQDPEPSKNPVVILIQDSPRAVLVPDTPVRSPRKRSSASFDEVPSAKRKCTVIPDSQEDMFSGSPEKQRGSALCNNCVQRKDHEWLCFSDPWEVEGQTIGTQELI